MFCGKCGNEVANDMEFCPKCGNKMKKDTSEVAKEKETVQNETESIANTNEQSTSTPKSGMTSSTKKILIGVGAFAVLAIICIIAIMNTTKYQTINLDDFVTISADGYDGYGMAKYELNTDALTADFVSKYKLKQGNGELENTIIGISNGLGLTDVACAEAFLLELGEMGLSKTEGLSNGDEIVFSWKTLSSNNGESVENLLKDYFSIKVEHEDIKYKVSDLESVETVDPFEGADISFSGVTGSNSITLNSKSGTGINYVIDGYGPYDNGQNVVVKAIPADFADWTEFTMNTGRKVDKETADMTISGLNTLITKLDQIPEAFHDEMIKSADSQMKAYIDSFIADGEWDGKNNDKKTPWYEYSEPILCKEYLISSVDINESLLILLYRIDFTVNWEDNSNDDPKRNRTGTNTFPVYSGFVFNNSELMLDPNGMITDNDTTGDVLQSDKNLRNEYCLYTGEGIKAETKYCDFNGAFTLDSFEKEVIEPCSENKDIKVISEFVKNVKETTLITKIDQIPEDFLSKAVDNAGKDITDFMNVQISKGGWPGKDTYDNKIMYEYSEPILCKEYLLSRPNDEYNELIFLYRVDSNIKYNWPGYSAKDGKFCDASFPVYVGYSLTYKRLMLDSEGKMLNDDVSGSIIDNKNYYLKINVYAANGKENGEVTLSFKKGSSLEAFERDKIDTRPDDKDVKQISEYVEAIDNSVLITKIDQIPEDYHKELISNADNDVKAFVNKMVSGGGWAGKNSDDNKITFDRSDPILCKEYLLSLPKDGYNELILLYRVDYNVKYNKPGRSDKDGEFCDVRFPVYIGYALNYRRIMKDENGKIVNNDVTGEIIKNNNPMNLFKKFTVYTKDGSENGEKSCRFDHAFTLENFELDRIDSRPDDKDIKIYSEYTGSDDTKSGE